ncbi:MAG: phosphoenolpyruvate carboxykinase (ATP), partial [Ardenticatenaceae bacterium]
MTRQSKHDITEHDLTPRGTVHWNLSPAELVEAAIRREEGLLTAEGPFNAITAPHTGRSPKDRFVVREPVAEPHVWWGAVNVPVTETAGDELRRQITSYLNKREELFVRDMYCGTDEEHRLAVRAINEDAWHNLFIYNMFIRPDPAALATFVPGWTILSAPHLKVEGWEELGFRSPTAVVVN